MHANYAGYVAWDILAAHCWKHLIEALGQLHERITQKKTYFTFFTSAKQSLYSVCMDY